MTLHRRAKGLSLEQVATIVGTDQGNLSRIEKGLQIPKRPLARALYFFYERQIPLGAIYDPQFYAAVPCLPGGEPASAGEYESGVSRSDADEPSELLAVTATGSKLIHDCVAESSDRFGE